MCENKSEKGSENNEAKGTKSGPQHALIIEYTQTTREPAKVCKPFTV